MIAETFIPIIHLYCFILMYLLKQRKPPGQLPPRIIAPKIIAPPPPRIIAPQIIASRKLLPRQLSTRQLTLGQVALKLFPRRIIGYQYVPLELPPGKLHPDNGPHQENVYCLLRQWYPRQLLCITTPMII